MLKCENQYFGLREDRYWHSRLFTGGSPARKGRVLGPIEVGRWVEDRLNAESKSCPAATGHVPVRTRVSDTHTHISPYTPQSHVTADPRKTWNMGRPPLPYSQGSLHGVCEDEE